MAPAAPTFDTAELRLNIFGQDHELSFAVRVGPCSLRDLLPAARHLADGIHAIAIEHARAQAEQVSCQVGCAWCCRHLIPVSPIEACALAELVSSLTPARQAEVRGRFAQAERTMEQGGLLDRSAPKGRHALVSTAGPGESGWENVSRRYFAARINCPFLEQERCSIYPERPLTCREYCAVTPAAWCQELSTRVRAIERPVHLSEVLTKAANAIAGAAFMSIPLSLALEWAEVHGATLSRGGDGEAMFFTLLEHLQAATASP